MFTMKLPRGMSKLQTGQKFTAFTSYALSVVSRLLHNINAKGFPLARKLFLG